MGKAKKQYWLTQTDDGAWIADCMTGGSYRFHNEELAKAFIADMGGDFIRSKVAES